MGGRSSEAEVAANGMDWIDGRLVTRGRCIARSSAASSGNPRAASALATAAAAAATVCSSAGLGGTRYAMQYASVVPLLSIAGIAEAEMR